MISHESEEGTIANNALGTPGLLGSLAIQLCGPSNNGKDRHNAHEDGGLSDSMPNRACRLFELCVVNLAFVASAEQGKGKRVRLDAEKLRSSGTLSPLQRRTAQNMSTDSPEWFSASDMRQLWTV